METQEKNVEELWADGMPIAGEPPTEALEIEALPVPPPAQPKIPMWAWGLLAFGAYKLMSKRR